VAAARPGWAIAAHGGAGAIARGELTPEQDRGYREAMARAVEVGAAMLRGGGSALDAVEAAVRDLEDDPLFNAGRGAVFTAEGRNELDAAIMDGRTLAAGAVAGVTRTRNPISLARTVMERSQHVFLAGEGAEAFARSHGVEAAEAGWFFTERRWRSLEKALARQGLPVPPRPAGAPFTAEARAALAHDEGRHGTVGVVALDAAGDVAAATSTGGTTAKRWGRIGDSPVIGAGTYAANAGCAVSATGAGEYFIRLALARTISAFVELVGLDLQAAVDRAIHRELAALGGEGGVIAVAPDGRVAWSFNTSGMYRARAAEGQPTVVGIYKDDP
jgi:beta-aspartyl-peptidase (threonine type)